MKKIEFKGKPEYRLYKGYIKVGDTVRVNKIYKFKRESVNSLEHINKVGRVSRIITNVDEKGIMRDKGEYAFIFLESPMGNTSIGYYEKELKKIPEEEYFMEII